MRAFSDINPFVLFIYFILVSCFPVFCTDGIIYFISFLGAIVYFSYKNGTKEKKTHFIYFVLFLVLTSINPLISHNGKTVLFVINNAPITLEAIIYGLFSSVLIISVMYWFRIFSQIMTSDKILYIFDRFSPKLALIISMSLRYIPLFKKQYKKIKQGKKILGEYKDDNIIDKIKVNVKSFSAMVTWTLENGIITAESMDARGYGSGRRSKYSIYFLTVHDIILFLAVISFSLLVIFFTRNSSFVFYPSFNVTVTNE
jgi:energy-coupling factor transport system permease protein